MTLYLSRVSLRRDASLAALAALLLPADTGEQAATAHRLIWAAFADGPERRRDFLWRQDEAGRWLVLSSRQPHDPHQLFEIESKLFDPVLTEGQRLTFALRANAVVTRKDEKGRSKRSDVVMDPPAQPSERRAGTRTRPLSVRGRTRLALCAGSKIGLFARSSRRRCLPHRKNPTQRPQSNRIGGARP